MERVQPTKGDADEDADEQETGSTTDYDDLLGMPIYSLTHEKIQKLLDQAKQKEDELMALLELTPIQIWTTDLDNFIVQWDVSSIYIVSYLYL